MRKNDYSCLQDLRLAPICSKKSLRHLGETISRLRLRKLVVVGLATKMRPLLRLRHLVRSVKIGSHKPWVQDYTNFDFEGIPTCRGTLLSVENLRGLVLQDCTNANGLISKLGKQGESLGSLHSIIIEYIKGSQQVNPITAITTANEPPGERVEVEMGRANREIQLIDASIKNSIKTLKYLRLNVLRNTQWGGVGALGTTQTPTFFAVQDIAQLNTYQNLRQLSLCLCLLPSKISYVCRALPPGLELLELSYRNKGYQNREVVRELMLMTYALKRRAVNTMEGCFPLKCIITTELRPCLDGDYLHSRVWLVDGGSGRVFVYDGGLQDLYMDGQPFSKFVKIRMGIIEDVL
ncbi:unnamed protein product [Tuber melanosporum]|uniref:(Perigord truffle) hypothetical protein n=1 Tax=Tuber melanosporum (strain Mel28) TaxID=656061 RepID=D5GL30_TUBMM|nr:uncharacterized protein GSTUM_00009943001 [Tuber melanosporum]CAZ85223.1 unnamed protein product [Tuber melanosporum]